MVQAGKLVGIEEAIANLGSARRLRPRNRSAGCSTSRAGAAAGPHRDPRLSKRTE